MKRKVLYIVSIVALAICIGVVALVARRSQQLHASALPIVPRELLSVPWGATPDTVSYRTVQADGWMGPSTIAIENDLVYIVDRINCEIKVYGQNGSITSRISLPEQYAKHPHQLEIVGESLYLTHYDTGHPMGLALFRDGQWSDIGLDESLPGFTGWLHLGTTGSGQLTIRRDVPPEEDTAHTARWAVLDKSGTLISSTVPMLASPDEINLEPHLITGQTGRQSIASGGQEIALVNRSSNIIKRAPIENNATTNVITMLKSKTQNIFVRARPLDSNLDKWTTYLTVFGPDLETRAHVTLSLPKKYRKSFVYPSSDVGKTEIVAGDKYYELIYLKNGIAILEWDPLAGK